MKTMENAPQAPKIHYAAPMKREEALTKGDWEHAYALACRESGVAYLTTPARKRLTRRKSQ